MENKIKNLNKNIEYFKVEIVQKDKVTIGLKNQNDDLLEKMAKKKT